ncbi:MAG: type I secretion system permease/ATPase [Chlorobiaceae bacterium]|nr:type I secretion system permease/ATPase [Chlorobiaceae bacterium]
MIQTDKKSEIREALFGISPWLNRVILFSLLTNILVLTPSWYMLEVYDRVVNSRNHRTLLMLTLLVVGLYALLEAIEWIRSSIMHEAGRDFDKRLRERVFDSVLSARLRNLPSGASGQALNDLRLMRDFISSNVILAFLDAPLALIVLVFLFMINPILCWFAIGGAVAQFLIGFFNERRIRQPLQQANRGSLVAQIYAGGVLRNAQVIESMGMLDALKTRWILRQKDFLSKQAEASDSAGTNAALSKLTQSLLSSLMLGMGCWLTIKGEMVGSGMIVGSILGGRILSPLVQIIGNWRQVDGARDAYSRLDSLLGNFPAETTTMPLPAPNGNLLVENITAGPPGTTLQILKNVGFRVAAGDSVAIVGPSASGKTTLARLLVGVWSPMNGKVRLDGSDIFAWNKAELGPHIGYLPQTVELFDGTIAENVSRFGIPDPEKVREACRLVGLEGFIETLPEKYETMIGDDGSFLSGGQRQRVALARAVYGMPKYVVLDEPNSSLDEAGDAALFAALSHLKSAGTTVIVVTHRLQLLGAIDYLLILVDGQIRQFGPRDQVLAAMQQKPAPAQAEPTEGRKA